MSNLLLAVAPPPHHGAADLPMEGFAANVTGGTGADPASTYTVINTNDSGPGSFRRAVTNANNDPGAALVRFDLPDGALITLSSTVTVSGNDITIDGSTSAGRFLIRSHLISNPTISVSGNNIILKHLRIHRGLGPFPCTNGKALLLYNARNVYILHCSIPWGVDETLTIWGDAGIGSQNVTVDYCMIYEALKHDHQPSGGTGFGNSAYSSVIGQVGTTPGNGRVSFIRSIVAHGDERTPCLIQEKSTEFINVITYNSANAFYWMQFNNEGLGDPLPANVRGMLFVAGPDTPGNHTPINAAGGSPVYFDDLVWQRTDKSITTSIGAITDGSGIVGTPNTFSPAVPVPVTVLPSNELWAHLKDRVGATQPQRSHSDQRIIAQIDTALAVAYGGQGGALTGGLIDTPVHTDTNVNPSAFRVAYPSPATWATVLTG